MKRLIVALVLTNILFNGYSQNDPTRWEKYVQPILDEITSNISKKIVLNSYFLLDVENGRQFDSIIRENYDLDSSGWRETWQVWKNNYSRHPEWKDWISLEKKDRILKSKRYKRGKLEMLSVSALIFINPDVYLLGIAKHCPGLCGSTDIYIVRIDRSNGELIIEDILKNVIVS